MKKLMIEEDFIEVLQDFNKYLILIYIKTRHKMLNNI